MTNNYPSVICFSVTKAHPAGNQNDNIYVINTSNPRIFIESERREKIEEVTGNLRYTWDLYKGGEIALYYLHKEEIRDLFEERGLAKLL